MDFCFSKLLDDVILNRKMLVSFDERKHITKIELNKPCLGLCKFSMPINNTSKIFLTGSNGSGKSRLLKLLIAYLENHNLENSEKIAFANFSHYETRMQNPDDFPYFVIAELGNKAIQGKSTFGDASRDAILLIHYLFIHDEKRFNELNDFLYDIIGAKIESKGQLTIFNLPIDKAFLSPGQQYLLRLSVAIFFNTNLNILILDEPELHLHPNVLIKIIKKISIQMPGTQMWIATHSLALLAVSEDIRDIWFLDGHNPPKLIESNSEPIINDLLGGVDNRDSLEALIGMPVTYATNIFAFETLLNQETAIESISNRDKQTERIVKETCNLIKNKKITIVDYGAGKGRLLQCLHNLAIDDNFDVMATKATDILSKLVYYAYDLPEATESKKCCMHIMDSVLGLRASKKYISHYPNLAKRVANKADFVFLINVLHEISPLDWYDCLHNKIEPLIKENGYLIIAEVDELRNGELSSDCGFLVVTENSISKLFKRYACYKDQLSHSRSISTYFIEKKCFKNLTANKIRRAVECIKKEALEKIAECRENAIAINKTNGVLRYYDGIRLSFWLAQYANAELALNKLKKLNKGE